MASGLWPAQCSVRGARQRRYRKRRRAWTRRQASRRTGRKRSRFCAPLSVARGGGGCWPRLPRRPPAVCQAAGGAAAAWSEGLAAARASAAHRLRGGDDADARWLLASGCGDGGGCPDPCVRVEFSRACERRPTRRAPDRLSAGRLGADPLRVQRRPLLGQWSSTVWLLLGSKASGVLARALWNYRIYYVRARWRRLCRPSERDDVPRSVPVSTRCARACWEGFYTPGDARGGGVGRIELLGNDVVSRLDAGHSWRGAGRDPHASRAPASARRWLGAAGGLPTLGGVGVTRFRSGAHFRSARAPLDPSVGVGVGAARRVRNHLVRLRRAGFGFETIDDTTAGGGAVRPPIRPPPFACSARTGCL